MSVVEPLRPVASPAPSVAARQIKMLRSAMGAAIASALEDPDVVEVLLNPDGTLWVDRLSSGRAPTGLKLSREDGDRIIRLVAAHVRVEVNKECPLSRPSCPRAASGSRV